LTALWRILFKVFSKSSAAESSFLSKRTLIIGTGSHASEIAKRLISSTTDVHHVFGFISSSAKELGQEISGFKVIGSLENINKVVSEYRINEVIFSSEELSYKQMMEVVSARQDDNVDFKIVGSNLDFLVGKTSVSVLEDVPLIEISYNVTKGSNKITKLILDYIIGLFVLFFIYPFIYLSTLGTRKRTDFQNFILSVPSVLTREKSFVGPASRNSSNLYLGKQGLTGLWYLDQFKGDPDKQDIFYAKNQNVWFDIEIIGKTLNKMWIKKSNG
jgi:hypothetical protein